LAQFSATMPSFTGIALCTTRCRVAGWLNGFSVYSRGITVIKFGVNYRVRHGRGSWWIRARPDTAKLTNVIVTGFVKRCNLVREDKMFVKDEAKISSSVRGVN